jgi:hypothetical protein
MNIAGNHPELPSASASGSSDGIENKDIQWRAQGGFHPEPFSPGDARDHFPGNLFARTNSVPPFLKPLEHRLPAAEGLHGRTSGSAVARGTGNSGLKDGPSSECSLDLVPCDTRQRYLQSTTPRCVRLPRVRADADVDKSLPWWSLHGPTMEIRRGGLAGSDSNGEFETQILSSGPLLLDCFVLSASAHLYAVIHIGWWCFQDDSKGQLILHGLPSIN